MRSPVAPDFTVRGMLTDSRSFMSYPRHEYFRRLLCDMFARTSKPPDSDDDSLSGPMIRNICYGNARRFLGLDVS